MNFFEVGVKENKDQLLLVTAGFSVPVPVEKQALVRPYLEKQVVMGIRPEDIHMPNMFLPG
jgi:ABC-type sugar transport system ATPase subunit